MLLSSNVVYVNSGTTQSNIFCTNNKAECMFVTEKLGPSTVYALL